MPDAVVAVDLGATSGRVMVGYCGPDGVALRQVSRFANNPVHLIDGWHWNTLELYRNVEEGLRTVAREESTIVSIGVDSWGVDYGLLRQGELAAIPFHYRDERTGPASTRVLDRISAADLYRRNGLQHMAINTIVQLEDDRWAGRLDAADRVLLTPDLIGYWLTGVSVTESTIASTTGLLSATSRDWDLELLDLMGLRRTLFTDLVQPGDPIGPLRASLDLPSTAVLTAVGSHDTASAVVGTPAVGDDFAYISCGTWGLVGVEVQTPILSDESLAASFTNEGGVDGRIRFQRNAMGMWILNESIRTWQDDGSTIDLPALMAAAGDVEHSPIFDADDPVFATPGDMPARIRSWFEQRGMAAPTTQAEVARCIIESLAEGFSVAVRRAGELSGRRISRIHLVGGGSQNAVLCQSVADRTGLTVLAGPVEATATGSVMVQARSAGLVSGDLESLRTIVASSVSPRPFVPSTSASRR